MKRIAVLGRTRKLLDTARSLLAEGYEIPIIGTAPAESHYTTTEQDFEALAKEIGADFFCDSKINAEEKLEQLRNAGCDMAVSVNWPVVMNEGVISIFSGRVLNAHAGDLPRYRGNACPNWAILQGEPNVVLCIHEMAPGEIDSGPIVLKDRMTLTTETYIGDIRTWLEERIPELMVEAVNAYRDGTANPVPQPTDPEAGLRCFPRRPEDGLIDWSQSVESVHRLVRASSRPFVGAFSFLDGQQRVTIWRAAPDKYSGPFLAVPGQILGASDRGVLVACGDDVLCLSEVSIENGGSLADDLRELGRSIRRRLG